MPEIRRKHSKVDKLPIEVVNAINDAIVNKKKTYKELEQWLKSDGYDIHKSSLQRYGKNFLSKLERITQTREQAKTIIETSIGLKTEMAEATSTVALQLLMEMLINTDNDNVNEMTLKAINALATLERSAVARERLKFEYDKGVSVAINEVEKQLRQELENYPDVLEKMINIAEKLRNDLRAI